MIFVLCRTSDSSRRHRKHCQFDQNKYLVFPGAKSGMLCASNSTETSLSAAIESNSKRKMPLEFRFLFIIFRAQFTTTSSLSDDTEYGTVSPPKYLAERSSFQKVSPRNCHRIISPPFETKKSFHWKNCDRLKRFLTLPSLPFESISDIEMP
jgi:hypothetical protein